MHYTCLPCARVIVRQLGEFLLDSWYFGIKTKNSTKNHISILGEALVDRSALPTGSTSSPEPPPAQSVCPLHWETAELRGTTGWRARRTKTWMQLFRTFNTYRLSNVRICIDMFTLCKTQVTSTLCHQTSQRSESNSEKVVPHRQHSTAPVTKDKSH